jgi:beta-glucosidase
MTATGTKGPGRALLFPKDFVWGAATAAYQIEGAAGAEGRGPSIWDTFSHTPGKVAGGDTGDVACDHYRRHADDVRLMRDLGLAAYRFSVSWPRVLPAGAGAVNAAGLDFYDRLVDELLAARIAPYVTLYHWDLPQALEDAGGWAVRDTAYRFAEYVEVVAGRLGDRVGTWMTLNEPWVAAILGYGIGAHAPGRASPADAFRASHHLLLAHGLGTAVLRSGGHPGEAAGSGGRAEIALTLNVAPVMTAEQVDDPARAPAAADAEAVGRVDALLNRQFLEPALNGRYPDEVLSIVDRFAGLGHIRAGDLALINQPIDLLGVNYYNPSVVRARPGAPAKPAFPGSEDIEFGSADAPTTAMGWPIVPTGLYELLVRLARDYPRVGLIVAENGAAFHDVVSGDRVRDADRIAYLDGHLRAAHAAIEAGVDLRGYLVWSLLDNFEWADGYQHKFGIVHVDFATQRRLLKDSGLWYREVIHRNGLRPDTARRPTLEEVAARAGVSRSTVSRVINGETKVSPESRDVVLHAVSELGYVANTAARTLATRQQEAARPANSIALIVFDPPAWPDAADLAADLAAPAFAALVRSVGQALTAAGKRVTLMLAGSADRHRHISQRIAAGEVDGALLISAVAAGGGRVPDELTRSAVPVIALDRPAAAAAVPYVAVDDAAGAAAAVRHLVAGGRRGIAVIGGPSGAVAAADRVAGYWTAIGEAGLCPMAAGGDFTAASGAAAARRLLAGHPAVDAIFAVGDLMAIGALHALRAAGRRVPGDVAVVGFGDIEAAAYTAPPLTTVRDPIADRARAAVRLLLARLAGEPADSLTLPAELVVRESA